MLRSLLRLPLPYAKPARKAKNHTRAHSEAETAGKASKGTFKLAS